MEYETLPELDFDIEHAKGAKHETADTLSRLEINVPDTREIDNDLPGDLALSAIFDKASTLNLDDACNDVYPYVDSMARTEVVSNVATHSHSG